MLVNGCGGSASSRSTADSANINANSFSLAFINFRVWSCLVRTAFTSYCCRFTPRTIKMQLERHLFPFCKQPHFFRQTSGRKTHLFAGAPCRRLPPNQVTQKL